MLLTLVPAGWVVLRPRESTIYYSHLHTPESIAEVAGRRFDKITLITKLTLGIWQESPRWLVMQGCDAEVESVLLKLHANRGDPNNDAAKAECYQIQKQIAIDRTLGNSWWHIIKKPSYRRRALLAIGVTGIIQCSGVLGTSSTSEDASPVYLLY